MQILYNLSDQRVIEETQVNLAYKWFIGVNPEDTLPDASQLSRFRNHHLGVSQVDDVLKQVISQCIDKGLIKSKTIILYATHTHAAAKRLFRAGSETASEAREKTSSIAKSQK